MPGGAGAGCPCAVLGGKLELTFLSAERRPCSRLTCSAGSSYTQACRSIAQHRVCCLRVCSLEQDRRLGRRDGCPASCPGSAWSQGDGGGATLCQLS
ncbi:hypothetical protein HaLaN_03572 [Haematococcus lacustris]|uniref:Uncharacterized protein n=1 Tax=Haematococcus lacustris TaxID=44745 RepID=A0A699YET5_HAELA|nr:hypothetical protein HaLaN_03572 [Haematococcus lacustris]